MKVAILEMPDTLEERLVWLERELVRPELFQLVEQLQIVGKFVPTDTAEIAPSDILAILGESEAAVRDSGLSSLDDEQLRLLLSNPALLFDLQQLVLESGSGFWIDLCNRCNQNRFATPKFNGESLFSSFKADLDAGSPAVISAPSVAQRPIQPASPKSWWGVFALAASILIAAGSWWLWTGSTSQPSGWGFSNMDTLASAETPEDYFQSLSGAANQWFKKPVTDAEQLSERLVQFSRGCEKLLQAEHSVLAPEQRAWLIEKCEGWKTKIDQLAIAVADGSKPFEQGLQEANDIATRMVSVLDEKSREV